MKRLIGSMMLMMVLSAHAQTSNVVFECKSTLLVDVNESIDLEIKVVEESSKLLSYLVGSGETGPLETDKQVVSLENGLKINGIAHILETIGLNPSAINNIDTVVIYTAGNFDDDLAGVRTAEFLNKKGHVLGAGMFFGWGGPVSCQ